MMCAMPSSVAEVVNPIGSEQIPDWTRSMAATFLDDPAGPDSVRRRALLESAWEPDRAWGARAQGRWVATLRTETRMLSVPGTGTATADIRADALTNVTVAASHRRQGLMRRMLTGSLCAAHERGDALSILLAAEWPIYGRFGYAPATLSADYVLRRSRRGSACDGDPSRVRAVDPVEFGRVAPDVFAAARRQRAGQLDRAGAWWDRVLGLGGFDPSPSMPPNLCVHEGEAGPDGIVGWKSDGGFGLVPPFGRVDVSWLSAATDEAYRNLWSYLTGIDIVDEIRLSARPVDERIRWLLPDARTLVTTEQVDFLWVRLLDVPAALAARRYARPGEVVLEVIDDRPHDFTSGRYRLAADGDQVTCERTDRAADIVLDQRALASIYLGGFRLEARTLDGSVREAAPRHPGADERDVLHPAGAVGCNVVLTGAVQEVGPGCWAWLREPGGWGQTNIGLVTGDGSGLLIDTPWDHRLCAAMLHAFAPALEDRPVSLLVNTHADGDHWWGNAVVSGTAEVLASKTTAAAMRDEPGPGEMVAMRRLARTIGAVPGRAGRMGRYVSAMLEPFAFEEVTPRLPDRTFSGRRVETVGGREVLLVDHGPAHTRSDAIVVVPDARVVFTGDLLFARSTPLMWHGPVTAWLTALESIMALDADVFVPGHGPVSSRTDLRALHDYWSWLNAAVAGHRAAGRDAAETTRRLARCPEFAAFREWENPERLALNVISIDRQLRGRGPILGNPLARARAFDAVAGLAAELGRGAG